jgi:hypothetical protein
MVETRGRTLEEMSRIFGIEGRLAQQSGIDVDDAQDLKPGIEVINHNETAK